MLLDSNILIYATEPEGAFPSRWVEDAGISLHRSQGHFATGELRFHLQSPAQGLDDGVSSGHFSTMNVALTDQAESFVLKKLGAGEFANAEAVVERALDAWQAREMFAGIDNDALKQSLLEAVRSPLRPYRPGQLVELVEDLIAERKSR